MAPNNVLPIHGNEKTMNLNSMILANIQASPYFKVQLYELKTYHQVIDEIYTRVGHLEPWEKGSRKTAGQTGMCGGVRGVGAGGIVSSSFCLLYKLYTLKLTRKQLMGVMTHTDSPFIRGIGFMYARFTQPPQDLWDWFEPYLDDEEEVDVKAGGGHIMTMGEMAIHFLTKLEWYSTLFPRIPVPIQKQIEQNLLAHRHSRNKPQPAMRQMHDEQGDEDRDSGRGESRELPYDTRDASKAYGRSEDVVRRSPVRDRERRRSRSPLRSSHGSESTEHGRPSDRDRRRSPDRHGKVRHRSRSGDRHSHSKSRRRSAERKQRRSRSTEKHSRHERRRSVERERSHQNGARSRSRDRNQHGSRSKDSHKHRSREQDSRPSHEDDYQRDLHKELERVKKSRSIEQD